MYDRPMASTFSMPNLSAAAAAMKRSRSSCIARSPMANRISSLSLKYTYTRRSRQARRPSDLIDRDHIPPFLGVQGFRGIQDFGAPALFFLDSTLGDVGHALNDSQFMTQRQL